MAITTSEKLKPDAMLLRVIRVAEILVKAEGHPEETPLKPLHGQAAVSANQTQKTQS